MIYEFASHIGRHEIEATDIDAAACFFAYAESIPSSLVDNYDELKEWFRQQNNGWLYVSDREGTILDRVNF